MPFIRTALVPVLLIAFVGCAQIPTFTGLTALLEREKKAKPDDDGSAETGPRTVLVGDHATVAGNSMIVVHGVGLVSGLNGTGEDPAPSSYRTQLVQEMSRRGVRNPSQVLASPDTALVLVTAYLPPDAAKGESFDVEVRLPPDSTATSLSGGYLLETYLTEKAFVPGRGELEGHEFGTAKGPILVSAAQGSQESLAGVLKRGRVLGGGTAKKDRTLGLYLRNESRGTRVSEKIARQIGKRFYSYEHGRQTPMAKAKTDQRIELKVHPRYKDNYPRYIQVIRNLAFNENSVQELDRIEKLRQKLLDPEQAALAAIQLEAIGDKTRPTLKTALRADNLESRFYAAEALAYLGDDAGVQVLAEAARNEPAFRVYALAAFAALDDPSLSQLHLRPLLDSESAETRYGAFRAMMETDPQDPFLQGKRLNDEYMLHVLDTDGPPMVHLSRYRRAEIVLFGAEQEFQAPLALKAGSAINVNAPTGSTTITVTRFQAGAPDQRRVVSMRVADVILACAELGASYPDIAMLLTQASNQRNLSGRLEFDAMPQPGRTYLRPNAEGQSPKPKKVGRNIQPSLFPLIGQPADGAGADPDDDKKPDADADEASADLPSIEFDESSKSKAWWPAALDPRRWFDSAPEQSEPEPSG